MTPSNSAFWLSRIFFNRLNSILLLVLLLFSSSDCFAVCEEGKNYIALLSEKASGEMKERAIEMDIQCDKIRNLKIALESVLIRLTSNPEQRILLKSKKDYEDMIAKFEVKVKESEERLFKKQGPIASKHKLSKLIGDFPPVETPTCRSIFKDKNHISYHQCIGMLHGKALSNCLSLENPVQKDACVATMIASDAALNCKDVSAEKVSSPKEVIKLCTHLKILRKYGEQNPSSQNREWLDGQFNIQSNPELQSFVKGYRTISDMSGRDHDKYFLSEDTLQGFLSENLQREEAIQCLPKENIDYDHFKNAYLMGVAYRGLELSDTEMLIPSLVNGDKRVSKQDVIELQRKMDRFLKDFPKQSECQMSEFVAKHGVSRLKTGVSIAALKEILRSGTLRSQADLDPTVCSNERTNAVYFKLHSGQPENNLKLHFGHALLLLNPTALDLDQESYISYSWPFGSYQYDCGSTGNHDLRRYSAHLNRNFDSKNSYFHEVTIRKPIHLLDESLQGGLVKGHLREIVVPYSVYKSLEEDKGFQAVFETYKDNFVIRELPDENDLLWQNGIFPLADVPSYLDEFRK